MTDRQPEVRGRAIGRQPVFLCGTVGGCADNVLVCSCPDPRAWRASHRNSKRKRGPINELPSLAIQVTCDTRGGRSPTRRLSDPAWAASAPPVTTTVAASLTRQKSSVGSHHTGHRIGFSLRGPASRSVVGTVTAREFFFAIAVGCIDNENIDRYIRVFDTAG